MEKVEQNLNCLLQFRNLAKVSQCRNVQVVIVLTGCVTWHANNVFIKGHF